MKFAKFKIAFTCCALLVGATQIAIALPKQGSEGKCGCLCDAPDGAGGSIHSLATYDPHGLSCLALAGATCNLDNTKTGGVATGQLIFCSDASNTAKRPATIILPTGVKIRPELKR